MKRLMDTFFIGYVKFKRNITIVGDLTALIFKGPEYNDFSIKRTPNNRIYLSRADGDTPLENFGYFDITKGHFVVNGLITQNTEHPQPEKGGLYFNTQTNTWYKCSNGTTWEQANI